MKYYKTHIILIIILSIFATDAAESSLLNNLKAKIGVYLGSNSNYHKADFMMLPDVPNCCVNYGDAKSIKYGFKAFGEVSLFDLFDVQLALAFNSMGADLSADEYIGNTEIKSKVFPVFTTHHLEADLGVFSFNPSISIVPYNALPLRFAVGYETGLLIKKSIYQHEDLSSEAVENGVIFYDGTNDAGTSRNIYRGDIPYTNNYNAITFSAAYDLEVMNKVTLRPEITYKYCLGDIAPSVNWKINTLSIGVSVCYDLFDDIHDITYIIDPALTDSIPEMISNNLRVSEEEINQVNAMLNDQSNDYKKGLPEEVQTVDQSKKENTFSCCYIIFYSSTERKESEKILKTLKNKMPNLNIYIQEWMNPESELIYFRVRTYCLDDHLQVFEIDNQYKGIEFEIDQPSIIKCY